MSADYITFCPQCGVHALRVDTNAGFETDEGSGKCFEFYAEYRGTCHHCWLDVQWSLGEEIPVVNRREYQMGDAL